MFTAPLFVKINYNNNRKLQQVRMGMNLSKAWFMYVRIKVEVKVLVAQSCLTLCDPMDYRPPGSSVHEIL